MAEFQLNAQVRTITGKKVNQLRNRGFVPATLYGPNTKAVSLQFDSRELDTTLRKAGGTNLIDVYIEDQQAIPVLAREVQRDMLKGYILHIDLFAVDMTAKIRAEVPVVFIGESPIVTSRKGIMITGPNSLTVEMLPSSMVHKIEVNVSNLVEMGDSILAKDLDLGSAVTIINDPDEMIAKVVQPSASRAAEAAAAEEVAVVSEAE